MPIEIIVYISVEIINSTFDIIVYRSVEIIVYSKAPHMFEYSTA